MEVLFIIIPILLLGIAKAREEQKERELGLRPTARKSKGLVDFMLYDFDRNPGDFR